MNVEIVKLHEVETVQLENGQFQRVTKNQQTVPCYITNYAVKKGKDLGLLEESLLQSLFKLKGLVNVDPNKLDSIDGTALQGIDEVELQKIIYLGCVGANKNFPYDFDAFLERFHYSFDETVRLYAKLISGVTTGQQNGFAKGLNKSTKTGKKKFSHRK
ncbi:hypothetical protein COM13_09145 [Bacillus pseudomycoides]|uniref:Uncharacterized protein n=1 Tax=Bacillus pseudomycoides TaxID=64104 RepID=A0ABD6TC16_9BACI|nr:hypothetical protein [Bacillus pseudomycoides]MBD5799995.1 hypothetical protein [Bacillus pseudomycoides]MED1478194.1 hypothetical protein [Bacillus pseudomycoides]PEK39065.1 hypothetical protein CN691_03800 [Bacillus pseudomycoides]PEO81897.1 hypothetical protein CN571_25680 [Bacillus pseudomycoides]PFW92273.1 hypothetical protein COL29_16415 [Bacillus pseudomycoides]